MLNVFVISSDKKIERLIAHFQPFFKTKIRSASDFDQGLKEVFENRPSVVFIQSTIGTVSGDTVARHIKSLLGSESPRIVFMGDTEAKGKKGTSWCDDWLYTGNSEQQLQQDFADLIAGLFPNDWQDIQAEIQKTAAPEIEDLEDFSDLLEKSSSDEISSNQDGSGGTASIATAEEPQKHAPEKIFDTTAESLPLGSESGAEKDLESFQDYQAEKVLEHFSSKSERRFTSTYLVVFLLLVAAGAGSYLWLSRPADRIKVATAPSSPAATKDRSAVPATAARSGLRKLPSFIRGEWRDPGYSAHRPGWERYVSPGEEFLVFRENNDIKAIQVISRGKNGISDTFLDNVLKEFGYDGRMPVGKRTQKDGFTITSSVLPGLAELVVYREQGLSQIKAFVLQFS